MKKTTLLSLLILAFSLSANAQLRENLSSPYDYTGPIISQHEPTVQNGLERFFSSVRMSHSYSMNFASFGGSYQSVNAYTNTLQFQLSPKLDGRVDISFLHSPFGASQQFGQNNSIGNQVLIRNAELNYKINDKAFIRIQYQQLPRGFGYNPYGYNRFNRNRGFGFWY